VTAERTSVDRGRAARLLRQRHALIRWYREHRRELPWRGTRNAYAIWVSEVMLQQTRVATVVPYFERFLERFPDLRSLAAAPEDAVLGTWSGLGYYRRARALHAGARAVMERHGGRVPNDPEALRHLPGVGRYTAGAIASIAFDRPEPVLDGNVRRVLSRLLGERFERAGPGEQDRLLWEGAAALVRGPSPGELNQALMELGAVLCTPRSPACPRCPVAGGCAAFASGNPEAYPRPRKRPPTVGVRAGVVIVRRGARFLLERPAGDSPLRGRWDLPAAALDGSLDAARQLARVVGQRHGVELVPGLLATTVRHGIMNRRLRLDAFTARLRRGRIAANPDLRWTTEADLDEVPVSGATRKILRALAQPGQDAPAAAAGQAPGRIVAP